MMNGIIIISILWLIALADCSLLKRSASPDSDNSEGTTDNFNSNYDEYPVSWPHWLIFLKKSVYLNSYEIFPIKMINDNQFFRSF